VLVLYREWLRGGGRVSKAEEVFVSIGVESPDGGNSRAEGSRRRGAQAMLRAIVAWKLANGASAADLARRWKIGNLEGLEERWCDELFWLLSGVAMVLEIRCFYHHLRDAC
jgi:helicase